MIEKGKNYKPQDLEKIIGPDWLIKLGLASIPYPEKPVINNYNEFDQETKNIYLKIYNLLKEKNPDQDFNVWASGSRVRGHWRTKEEANTLSIQYNTKVKYSDYDFCTDAKNIPPNNIISEIIGEKIDRAGCDYHKVLIEIV